MINTPILYQGNTVWVESECAWFSILWALLRMKPDTDYIKIGKEIIAEDWNSMGFMRAINWFIKKGYVKGYKKCIFLFSIYFLISKSFSTTISDAVDCIKLLNAAYVFLGFTITPNALLI